MVITSLFNPESRARADADDLDFSSPEELEFYAENETVRIVPNISINDEDSSLHCIEGSYGPFTPNHPIDVPIWMAMALYKRNLCRVISPDWMSLERLTEVLMEEKTVSSSFQPLPYYYLEIAHILFRGALSTFQDDLEEIRSLVESIRRVRYHKIENGLKQMSGKVTVKLNHLSATEINMMRRLFAGVLDTFYELGKRAEQDMGGSMPAM